MADIISICGKRDRAKLDKEAVLSRRKQRAIENLVKRSCCATQRVKNAACLSPGPVAVRDVAWRTIIGSPTSFVMTVRKNLSITLNA